eukprot:scaffold17197_cov101-Isochrysis_galbana.AAC.1
MGGGSGGGEGWWWLVEPRGKWRQVRGAKWPGVMRGRSLGAPRVFFLWGGGRGRTTARRVQPRIGGLSPVGPIHTFARRTAS